MLSIAVARSRVAAVPAGSGREVGHITAAERAATFSFAPTVSPYDRQVLLGAVARARPDARRLIAASTASSTSPSPRRATARSA